MKNIIPFKKDVIFKTNLSEITSISLENTLSINNDTISGDFIISGDYKVSDNSTSVEPFELKLPFEIIMDDRYDTKKATIDIDDFYYEIVNNNVLSVTIDVLVDKLQEKELVELDDLVEEKKNIEILNKEEEEMDINNIFEERSINVEEKDSSKDEEIREEDTAQDKINSLFSQISNDNEVYVTYNVFILRDGDTIDSVLEKYNITEEELKKYNDLSNLQLGDKLIIPNTYERD